MRPPALKSFGQMVAPSLGRSSPLIWTQSLRLHILMRGRSQRSHLTHRYDCMQMRRSQCTPYTARYGDMQFRNRHLITKHKHIIIWWSILSGFNKIMWILRYGSVLILCSVERDSKSAQTAVALVRLSVNFMLSSLLLQSKNGKNISKSISVTLLEFKTTYMI